MNKWWKDPRLDDEGTYDYLVEELPENKSEWSWYPTTCGDCGKERRLHITHSHYFYCWDGWDCMDYSVCWKCYCKSVVKSIISKIKTNILKRIRMFNIPAYIAFRKFCKKHNIAKEHREHLWGDYYIDIWADKKLSQMVKGARS